MRSRPRIAETVAALVAAVLFLVLLVQIVLRSLGAPLVWVEEFSTIAFVVLVFTGATAAFQRREHLEVDLLYRFAAKRASPALMAGWSRLVLALQIVCLTVLCVGLVLMARQAWNLYAGTLGGFRYGWLYVAVFAAVAGALLILVRRALAGESIDTGDTPGPVIE